MTASVALQICVCSFMTHHCVAVKVQHAVLMAVLRGKKPLCKVQSLFLSVFSNKYNNMCGSNLLIIGSFLL